MAEILELAPAEVSAASRLTLAKIEATMIWPDDASMRLRWLRTCEIEAGKEMIDLMPESVLREFAKEAIDAPRIADLRQNVGKREAHGLIAGIVCLEATVFSTAAPERAALRKVQQQLCEHLKGVFQIEPRTINNKQGPVYKYRAVAHLWGAYMLACHHGDRTRPCQARNCGAFLATAEKLRLRAEKARAPGSNTTVMRPGEAVVLPPAVIAILPQVELKIAPPARSPDFAS